MWWRGRGGREEGRGDVHDLIETEGIGLVKSISHLKPPKTNCYEYR
jgi:hypothetical protein